MKVQIVVKIHFCSIYNLVHRVTFCVVLGGQMWMVCKNAKMHFELNESVMKLGCVNMNDMLG
jgi:hypothetical protein